MKSVEATALIRPGNQIHREEGRRCIECCFLTALVGVGLIIHVVVSILREDVHITLPALPSDFIWGAATSSFQIEGGTSEGGRGPSIWDIWCKASEQNCNGENGEVADDHYHRWKEDVKLMKAIGLKAYRFSISWSRILPKGKVEYSTGGDDKNINGVNYAGIQFYNNLIDELLDSNIVPFVTLYHWDLPQSLQETYGGWEDRAIIDDFANYARICFHFFNDRVKYWITINEAWTVAIHGYEEASKAPGVLGKDVGGSGDPYLVGNHFVF